MTHFFIMMTILSTTAADYSDTLAILQSFKQPPRTCTQVPFWFWNGPLDADQFQEQLREMRDKGVYAAMPHPRFGMDRRQYLEGPYWQAMAATIREARRLDMQIWLYDEYNWPSGGAGGRVTDGHPEYYPRGLDYLIKSFDNEPGTISITEPEPTESKMECFEKIIRGFIKSGRDPVASYRLWGKLNKDQTAISGRVPDGRWDILVFFQCLGRNPSPLDIGSNSMTDYLSPEPVKRFLNLTHDQYYKRFKEYFGKTVPAIFTDEASTTSPSPFPWTEKFDMKFHDEYGFDILDNLPFLIDPESDKGSKVRLAYWQTVTSLFAESFIGHLKSWCDKHDIELTGHIYEENISSYAHSSHLMTILAGMDRPGFDALGPRCPPHNAKAAISVAQLEGKEAVCECLGLAGGWNCNLNMLRTGYNILGALGVERFVPHAFYQTLDNPRVESFPSFFYDNPYWKYYKRIAYLSARLSYFNKIGVHVAPCAVYYPIESLWADSAGGKGQNVLPWQHRSLGIRNAEQTCRVFNNLVDSLYAHRWDLDVVDSRLLGQSDISVNRQSVKLSIGPEEFRILIVPPVSAIGLDGLRAMDRFLRKGGWIVWLERLPDLTWPLSNGEATKTFSKWFGGRIPEKGRSIHVGEGTFTLLSAEPETVLKWLDANMGPHIQIEGGLDSLRVNHKKTSKANMFLLFNDSDKFISGQVDLLQDSIPIVIDIDTGKAYTGATGGFGLKINLRPYQSVCALYTSEDVKLPPWSSLRPKGKKIDISDNWTIQLAGKNLDDKLTCSLGPTQIDVPVFRVRKRNFSKVSGWTEPGYNDTDWEDVCALRGECLFTDASSILLRTKLPPGVKAIMEPLPVTGEYALWIDGRMVEKRIGLSGDTGGKIELYSKGINSPGILALETYSHHGPAGLTDPVTVICGPAQIDSLKSWEDLGFGFYSGRVLYRRTFAVDDEFKRAWLDLGKVQHYVEVYINNNFVDLLLWPPYELQITSFVRKGSNEIALVVSNNIANRFAWDVWGTRGQAKAEPSGILGPAHILIEN
jgi:hypothetical protein